MTKQQEKELLLMVDRIGIIAAETRFALDLLLRILTPEIKKELLRVLETEGPHDGEAAKIKANVRDWLKGVGAS